MTTKSDITKAPKQALERVDPPLDGQIINPENTEANFVYTDTQLKNINWLIDKKYVSTREAMDIVKTDETWNNFLTQIRQNTMLKNIELIEKVQAKIAEKVDQGFMEAGQKGGILLAILTDKTFGPISERNGPMFNVNGKNVGIKVNFDFKPQKKK